VTRGERNIRWIEQRCRVPEGRLVGQPVRLRDWQQEIVRGIYDRPTRRAIVSFGRKNGKTAISAFLLLLHLCGPEARANSSLFSAAQSRDQAAILFGLAAKVVRMSPDLSAYVTVRDTIKQLHCKELGTLYQALSAEASTAYGLSPVFIVHDELGQVKGPSSELYEALETATAAQENPLSIIISTQAPTDADLLSVLIDDARKEDDPRVRLFLYTADPDAEAFEEETIRQANPAFGDFQNADEVLAMAEDARRMPSREPEYRNLILNQRVEASAPFISRTLWNSCGSPTVGSFKGLPVYGGLDLSESNDLTAFVAIAPVDGVWHVKPTFWLPGEGLRERSRVDRVPYDLWASQGHLIAIQGAKSIEYEYVATYLRGFFDAHDVRQVAFDRWNFRHLRPWLLRSGFTEDEIEARFVEFGQGFQSMSPALRELEGALLNGKIAHGNHPVLTMCANNAVVQRDPSGNRKLAKNKSRGRIDGMVSLAMSMSLAATHVEQPQIDIMAMIV
jgi:phage terminase large subunit-like protein